MIAVNSPTRSPSPPRRQRGMLLALPSDGDLPHELNWTQLSGLHQLTPTTYAATWLHTPVLVQVCASAADTHAARSLIGLRHPNLEFLLGITRTPVAAVTERPSGSQPLSGLPLSLPVALSFALDLGRGLLYLHAKTGEAHGGVAATAVIVYTARRRAVLRMQGRPLGGGGRSFGEDARALVNLLHDMLGGEIAALHALAREHVNGVVDGKVANLAKIVGTAHADPEGEGHAVSMDELVAMLNWASTLAPPPL
jgi:hypothetical protein